KPSAGIEKEHRYRMMLAHLDLEFGGGSRRRRGVPVKREESLVERANIPGEDLRLVVLRIDGDEQNLDALAVLAEKPDRLAQRRQRERADVGAARVAEIEGNRLAAKVRQLMDNALIPHQAEVAPPRHAADIGRLESGVPRSKPEKGGRRDSRDRHQHKQPDNDPARAHRNPNCAENWSRFKVPESPPVTS